MKKLIKNIFTLGLAAFALTACSDVADEITSLALGRNLSPTDFESRNVSETTANLRWTATEGATSYIVEVFADDSLTFEGTPEQTLVAETNSIALSNLNYDTKYSARVMAVTENEENRSSKWTELFFRTSAQQFLKTFKEESIADRSLTVTWDAEAVGTEATAIKVLDESNKVVATKSLTAEELEAGEAVIDGLTPETKYTVKLYNGEKERGSRAVTTIADLAGAILVHEGDNLTSLIKDAEDGSVFALYGGTYELNVDSESGKTSSVKVTTSITIKGIYPTNRPVIKGRFEVNEGASLNISQVILDGADNSTTDQTFNFKTADAVHNALTVQSSVIRNYVKGLFYLNVTATVKQMIFNDCIFENIECNGGDMFDSRKGYIADFQLTNSTIYKSCKGRTMLRYDDASSSFPGVAAPEVLIDHCTIDSVESMPAGTSNMNGLVNVRFGGADGHNVTISNNLITNAAGGTFSKYVAAGAPSFTNNYYFGCNDGFFKNVEGNVSWAADESCKNGEDPKYKDSKKGDFTIGNESVSKLGVGDPRWLTAGE